MKFLNLALRKQHNLDRNIMKPSEKQRLATDYGSESTVLQEHKNGVKTSYFARCRKGFLCRT